MGQSLNRRCDLFMMAADAFDGSCGDYEIIDIEVLGNGNLKVWYDREGVRCYWSKPIIEIVRDWSSLFVVSHPAPVRTETQ